MSEAHATPRLTLQRGSFPRYLAALATLVALADFLFYGHNIGLSAAIFVLCTGLAASLTQPNAPQAGGSSPPPQPSASPPRPASPASAR